MGKLQNLLKFIERDNGSWLQKDEAFMLFGRNAVICGNRTLSSLQKCEQNLISFSFEANMNEAPKDRAIKMVVSVREHELPKQE